MTNRLLTLETAVSAGEKVETIQTSRRGRIRVVVVEKSAIAPRAWTSKRVDSSPSPRELEKAPKPRLSALERKRQQREAAKIERTRKAIEKRREQKRAKAAQPPNPEPHSRPGKAKHRARLIALGEARKDRVAQLAQSLLNAAVASLPDRVKAKQELAWLDRLHVVNWANAIGAAWSS